MGDVKTEALKMERPDPRDPWQHRSSGMQCLTCMWYLRKGPGERAVGKKEIGRCRRRAPTMAGFPAVFPGDWCGDHKINEEAL